MKQSQSVQVTSAPSITVAEGQPTMTNSHVPWMWDTKHVGNSARMALTARALCKTAGAPLPAGQPPSSLHLLHWANWFNRDCWVTNYGAY